MFFIFVRLIVAMVAPTNFYRDAPTDILDLIDRIAKEMDEWEDWVEDVKKEIKNIDEDPWLAFKPYPDKSLRAWFVNHMDGFELCAPGGQTTESQQTILDSIDWWISERKSIYLDNLLQASPPYQTALIFIGNNMEQSIIDVMRGVEYARHGIWAKNEYGANAWNKRYIAPEGVYPEWRELVDAELTSLLEDLRHVAFLNLDPPSSL